MPRRAASSNTHERTLQNAFVFETLSRPPALRKLNSFSDLCNARPAPDDEKAQSQKVYIPPGSFAGHRH